MNFQNAQEVSLILKVTARLMKVSMGCYMRESRNFHQGGGGGGSKVHLKGKKARTTFLALKLFC